MCVLFAVYEAAPPDLTRSCSDAFECSDYLPFGPRVCASEATVALRRTSCCRSPAAMGLHVSLSCLSCNAEECQCLVSSLSCSNANRYSTHSIRSHPAFL